MTYIGQPRKWIRWTGVLMPEWTHAAKLAQAAAPEFQTFVYPAVDTTSPFGQIVDSLYLMCA